MSRVRCGPVPIHAPTRFSTIICAPVYSTRHGLATQVDVGLNEGLRHDSSVHCDELVSLRKSQLTQFVGTFDTTKSKGITNKS